MLSFSTSLRVASRLVHGPYFLLPSSNWAFSLCKLKVWLGHSGAIFFVCKISALESRISHSSETLIACQATPSKMIQFIQCMSLINTLVKLGGLLDTSIMKLFPTFFIN